MRAFLLLAVILSEAVALRAGETMAEGVLRRAGQCEIADEGALEGSFLSYLRSPALGAGEADPCIAARRDMAGFLGRIPAASPDLGKAWDLLKELSRSPSDPDAAELFHAVLKASLLMRRNAQAHPEGEALRRRREILSWNLRIERKKESEALEHLPPPGKGGRSRPLPSPPPPPRTEAPLERELAEIQNELDRLDLGGEVGELQARLELQDLALRFLRKGDPEAAILAVRWCTGLFGEGRLQLGPDAAEEIAGRESATLADLEATASRVLASVGENLAAARLLLERKAMGAAGRSLSAAFAEGSCSFAVRRFPGEEKAKILARIEEERNLVRLIGEKSHGEAEALWNRLSASSSDFDGYREISAIRAGKALSDLHLGQALRALEAGDGTKASSDLEAASSAWPGNPAIDGVRRRIEGDALLAERSRKEFHRLHDQRELMAILAQEARFRRVLPEGSPGGILLSGDLEHARRIDEGIREAGHLRSAGLTEHAWEKACLLAAEFPGQREAADLEHGLRPAGGPLARAVEGIRSREAILPGPALASALLLQSRFPESPVPPLEIRRLVLRILGPDPGTRPDGAGPFSPAGIPSPRSSATPEFR